ncbi:class II glutamine amidotransferase [Blastopirellula sp. JC732]|uniref:Class II glutamine amidotransferase n=1 Tax=Blastopirellula sediminis TaxID=2894196 RepID=A0A9X1MJH3_9BACT|nr:class II glutamine amidotransferase [Blastopirellula sediminis]MCC9607725.1 class II glutamine amidotransferase [Blastopirellula sediminis]MCC9627482.1 class II glutamine amidotransferase [Blastopirellula sediminis]
MCRWLAYHGPSLRLSALLTRPDHSLIDQSRHARQNVETTNGDGFGVGWYGEELAPGLYRETHPAWNDLNFQHLADHIHSRLFLAHVRAATGTPIQRTNCHPFAFENWLFQHNGSVPEFRRLKRRLLFDIDPRLFPFVEGSTDSETLFYLALTFGLRDDPPAALAKMIAHVEQIKQAAEIDQPFNFSACTTDGERIWAVRYASDGESRTLYHSRHVNALRSIDGTYAPLPEGAAIVLSEPLDEVTEHWEEVPEGSLLTVNAERTTITPFEPAFS